MKERPDGFLGKEEISHESEAFDYIRELHKYLWFFVRAFIPSARGNLHDYVDKATEIVATIKLKKEK